MWLSYCILRVILLSETKVDVFIGELASVVHCKSLRVVKRVETVDVVDYGRYAEFYRIRSIYELFHLGDCCLVFSTRLRPGRFKVNMIASSIVSTSCWTVVHSSNCAFQFWAKFLARLRVESISDLREHCSSVWVRIILQLSIASCEAHPFYIVEDIKEMETSKLSSAYSVPSVPPPFT